MLGRVRPLLSFPAIIAGVSALLMGCASDASAPSVPPPPAPVLLKEIVIPNLPSPYYHFEYGTDSRVRTVSFASGLRTYDVIYNGARIAELRNNTAGNSDRLVYSYDDAGHVSMVKYIDGGGQVVAVVFLTYSGARLTELERDRKVSAGYLAEKIMSFTYDADGNVFEVTERFRFDGSPETVTVDRYEDYDGKVNVDGFSLVHDEFFDHLVLLPGLVLQKSNPRRVTRTGDGTNFVVDHTYTYDAENRPLVKSGDLLITNGSDAGRRFAIRSDYSYY
ncbi:MAG TPA: hypothetical protein VF021_02495 [Longimicrobiales bacterium]